MTIVVNYRTFIGLGTAIFKTSRKKLKGTTVGKLDYLALALHIHLKFCKNSIKPWKSVNKDVKRNTGAGMFVG